LYRLYKDVNRIQPMKLYRRELSDFYRIHLEFLEPKRYANERI